MKQQNKKSIVIICACLCGLLAVSLLVPDFLKYNLSYKNGEMAATVPNEISSEVAELDTNLPIIYLYSYEINKLFSEWSWSPDGPAMPRREESLVDIYVYNRDVNRISDPPVHIYYNTYMKLRGRTSSYMQDKKPFSLEFRNRETGLAVNYPFLSLDAESDFVFHAPYIDRSLIRNWLAYSLQGQILDWAPDCRFAEVFIDTPGSTVTMGDYVGIYLIVEKIKRGRNRIALGDYEIAPLADNQFEQGGNFIFKRDAYEEGYDTAIRLQKNSLGNEYSLVYPKGEVATEDVVNSIYNEIDLYEQALYTGTDRELEKYYDIKQIARCILVDEFLKNHEGFSSSLYFYREKGGKIKAVQWDFDLGTGNTDYTADLSSARTFDVLTRDTVTPYLKHDNFTQELIAQWKLLRAEGGRLSEENIIFMLDEVEEYLSGAWQRSDSAYPSIFYGSLPFGNHAADIKSSKEERAYIKEYLIERGRWLDEHIDEVADWY